MAREGVHADYLREQQLEQEQEEAVVIVANERQRFVDAARVLMLWGWGALAAVSTAPAAVRSRPPDDASSAVQAFLGLVLWLLGVSLVALVPLARRFPRARRVGDAVANAVIDCFFPPPLN